VIQACTIIEPPDEVVMKDASQPKTTEKRKARSRKIPS
jgi:hypothetical protein